MRKYFREYINFVTALLKQVESGAAEIDGDFFVKFDIMLARMQHERLCHLIVTVLFALLTVMTLGFLITGPNLQLALLFMLFLVLVIPYVEHYYFLENGVQKLYRLGDKLRQTKPL
jgi:hypothetical protein